MESMQDRMWLGVAHALFMNRLHVLRLTEIVRLGIKPDDEGMMDLPAELDEELKRQAIDFVLTCFPSEFQVQIHEAKTEWMRPA